MHMLFKQGNNKHEIQEGEIEDAQGLVLKPGVRLTRIHFIIGLCDLVLCYTY